MPFMVQSGSVPPVPDFIRRYDEQKSKDEGLFWDIVKGGLFGDIGAKWMGGEYEPKYNPEVQEQFSPDWPGALSMRVDTAPRPVPPEDIVGGTNKGWMKYLAPLGINLLDIAPLMVLFKSRPWLRKFISETIPDPELGAKWLAKYSEDVPSEKHPVKMLRDYYKSVGITGKGENQPLSFAPEWEARLDRPRREIEASMMPEGWHADTEIALQDLRPPEKPGDWKWWAGAEIKPEGPSQGWEGIVQMAKDLAEAQYGRGTTEEMRKTMEPIVKGGPQFGGGGHLNVSAPSLPPEKQADLYQKMTRAWLEAEPLLYPVRAAHKRGERIHVGPLAEHLRGYDPLELSNMFSKVEKPSQLAYKTGRPGRESAVNWKNLAEAPEQKRVEFRGFESPEDWWGWFENMAAVEALRQRAKSLPEIDINDPTDMLAEIFKSKIEPNMEELSRIRAKQAEVAPWMTQADPGRGPQQMEEFAINRDPFIGMSKSHYPLMSEKNFAARDLIRRRPQRQGLRRPDDEFPINLDEPTVRTPRVSGPPETDYGRVVRNMSADQGDFPTTQRAYSDAMERTWGNVSPDEYEHMSAGGFFEDMHPQDVQAIEDYVYRHDRQAFGGTSRGGITNGMVSQEAAQRTPEEFERLVSEGFYDDAGPVIIRELRRRVLRNADMAQHDQPFDFLGPELDAVRREQAEASNALQMIFNDIGPGDMPDFLRFMRSHMASPTRFRNERARAGLQGWYSANRGRNFTDLFPLISERRRIADRLLEMLDRGSR